jgi:uncharacterized membrane protein
LQGSTKLAWSGSFGISFSPKSPGFPTPGIIKPQTITGTFSGFFGTLSTLHSITTGILSFMRFSGLSEQSRQVASDAVPCLTGVPELAQTALAERFLAKPERRPGS